MFNVRRMPPELDRLLDYPVAVDVLDLLAAGPAGFSALRTMLRVRRRELDAALRVLAAHGLVHRHGHLGTWDWRAPLSARYALTDDGRDLAARLDDLDVWVTIYQRYLH